MNNKDIFHIYSSNDTGVSIACEKASVQCHVIIWHIVVHLFSFLFDGLKTVYTNACCIRYILSTAEETRMVGAGL